MQWEVEHGCFLESSLFNKLILLFNRTERPLASSWPPYLTCVKSQGSGLESQTVGKGGKEREKEREKKLKNVLVGYTTHPKWSCFAPLPVKNKFPRTVRTNSTLCKARCFTFLNAIFKYSLFLASLLVAVCAVVNNANNFRMFTLTGTGCFLSTAHSKTCVVHYFLMGSNMALQLLLFNLWGIALDVSPIFFVFVCAHTFQWYW